MAHKKNQSSLEMSCSQTREIKEMSENIRKVTESVNTLNVAVGEIKVSIDNIGKDVIQIKQEVKPLNDKVIKNEAEITHLVSTIKELKKVDEKQEKKTDDLWKKINDKSGIIALLTVILGIILRLSGKI